MTLKKKNKNFFKFELIKKLIFCKYKQEAKYNFQIIKKQKQ